MIVLKTDPLLPDDASVSIAAEALRRGELVIFPTETVYGLAANALDLGAVEKVFEAKGRSTDQPLPVQILNADMLEAVAIDIPRSARILARHFWPGPLTMVLRRSPNVPDIVTSGGANVGVRVPDHAVALKLLEMVGFPIVATSANASGGEAPRTAAEAVGAVGEWAAVALDAGPARIGVASTVLDISDGAPRVLRTGSIGLDRILTVLEEGTGDDDEY
jgi:L-threonylcarbamoyladenylate synthase